jgi:hypothetical protein
MRIMLFLAMPFVLAGCGDLPSDQGDVQEQQIQRSFYGSGNPNQTTPPVYDDKPKGEPVPGEIVP